MNGIFNYQVPGHAPQLNQAPKKPSSNKSLSTQQSFYTQADISAETDLHTLRLMQELWHQLRHQHRDQPVRDNCPNYCLTDTSTYSMGEEEGKPIAAPAYTDTDHGALTPALGEEESGPAVMAQAAGKDIHR